MQVACVLKQLKQLIYFVIRHTRHLYVSSYRCIRHAIRWLLVFFLRLFAICLLDNCVFSTLGRSSYGIRYDSRFFLLLIDYHQFSEIHLGYLIGWGSSLVLLFFFCCCCRYCCCCCRCRRSAFYECYMKWNDSYGLLFPVEYLCSQFFLLLFCALKEAGKYWEG